MFTFKDISGLAASKCTFVSVVNTDIINRILFLCLIIHYICECVASTGTLDVRFSIN